MIANPPPLASDAVIWQRSLDGWKTDPAALKYGGRYVSGNQWRINTNTGNVIYPTLLAAQTRRTADINIRLGDLNVRYGVVQVIGVGEHPTFVSIASATLDEVSTFQVTGPTQVYTIIGWTATQARVNLLAAAFRLAHKATIYEQIIDIDDGFSAWDPLTV
jgi:hypothetical protein